MYIRDRWYVVAASSEISRRPLRRKILNEPLVMYRGESGSVIAMDDTCPHRFAPLSAGVLIGDRIQCPYHGIEFARGRGAIVVPGLQPAEIKAAVGQRPRIGRAL